MMRARTYALVLSLGAAALGGAAACESPDESVDTTEQRATELDKADWLEKAAKVLRDGEGLGPDDDVAALLAMPKSDVVDLWMKDPRFGDAVLAFNLYFLGRSIDQVKTPSEDGGFVYDRMVFEFPQALGAAKAVVDGGNYYELFSGTPPEISFNPKIAIAPDDERDRVLAMMDAAIDRVASARASACEEFAQAGLRATKRLRVLGLDRAIEIRRRWLSPEPNQPGVHCEPGSDVSDADLATSMTAVRNAIENTWKSAEARTAPSRVVRSISDISTISLESPTLPALVEPLGDTFFTALPATSTNFHRKRAAFMLKTYFCDDLTPLELPATEPQDGGSDVHASNPNCQACHSRLDPIGALFRDIGARGADFAGQQAIVFDDGVSFNGAARDQYLSQWQNPDGSFRAGYWITGNDGRPRRDPGWTDADGDKLPGFWSFARRSKVVTSCLVRRLGEYVLGPKQVYDREWLAQISSALKDGSQSGAAFKSVVKSLVLSKTFSTHNPVQGTCYDVPEGAPPNRSPCAIAHVVASQCAVGGCHDSVNGSGHLDFKTWKDIGGGVYSWAHNDEQGNQLPRAESLRRMRERITHADRRRRMPLLRAMPADEFTTFRDWLTKNLENP